MVDKKINRKIVKRDNGLLGLGIGLVLAVIVLFSLLLFAMSANFVDSGERRVVLRLGEINRVMGPGFHFNTPMIESVVKYSIRTQKYQVDASQTSLETAASKDLQIVKIRLAVNYHLMPDKVSDIYRELGEDYVDNVIQPTVQEVMKAVTSQFTAEELLTRREEVKVDIEQLLRKKLDPRHIVVEQISITDFDFSDQFNQAIETKVSAEQNALAAKNKLEQVKFEAEMIVTTANAEATKITVVNEALQKSQQYVQYQAIQKWNGVMPMITGGALPFVNIPTFEAAAK